MRSRNFKVKLTPLSHLVTDLGPLPNLRHKLTTPPPSKSHWLFACGNKSDVSFLIPTSAVNVTFAAECRAVTSAAAPLMVYARRSAANLPHVGTAVAWWDRQTDGHKIIIGSAPYIMRALSILLSVFRQQIPAVASVPCETSQRFTLAYPLPHKSSHQPGPSPSSVTSFMDVPVLPDALEVIHDKALYKIFTFKLLLIYLQSDWSTI